MSLQGDDRILVIFAYFIILFILFALIGIDRELGRIARLLERANDQRDDQKR